MVVRRLRRSLLLLVGMLILTTACAVEDKPQLQIPDLPPTVTPTPGAALTPQPARVLSICLGREPRSLFTYGDGSTAARVIRQAIYDGPVDTVNFESQPVILQEIPSRDNNGVQLREVEVASGEKIVDHNGVVTFLAEGVTYRPSGCRSTDCEEVYQGQGAVTLDQVVIRYRLLPGVRWSDGEQVTAADSHYSYQIARAYYGELGPPKLRFLQSYRVLDEETVTWIGLPGYSGLPSYADFFFHPVPEHRWTGAAQASVPAQEAARKSPLSWGAFQLQEWIAGDHISLSPNEEYFRRGEDIPYYAAVVFRFVPDVEQALHAYRAGECALVIGVPGLLNEQAQLAEAEIRDELNLVHIYGGAWEHLLFGIQPLQEQPALLQDPDLRKAVARCIDRQAIVDLIPAAPRVADSYYPAGHPWFNDEIPRYRYQPQRGNRELEALGWVDHDQRPTTPRQAQGVDGVDDGTALQLSLHISESKKSLTVGEALKGQLAGCGVEVVLEALPAEELLAPGPAGPIFGRSFEMAEFAWTSGDYQLCSLFLTSEIPGPPPDFPKAWGGGNAAGFANEDFDAACRDSLYSLPDLESTREARAEAQRIFAELVPALPLYFRQQVYLADPSFGDTADGYYTPLWNIETLP